MDLFDVLQLIRRRWPVIMLTVLVGATAGFATAPGEGTQPVQYSAKTTLLLNPSESFTEANLQQAALLVTTGEVPDLAAERIGVPSGAEAKRGVSATAALETASIQVAANRSTAADAEVVSSAFADSLVEFISRATTTLYEEQLQTVSDQVAQAQSEVDLTRLAAAQNEVDPEQDAAVRAAEQNLSTAQAGLAELQAQGPPQPPLVVIERGDAQALRSEGVRAPDGKPERAALLGVFGVFLGVGAAFALDQLDTKLRDKTTTEAAFGVPVIAEIPPLPGRKKHRGELLALTQPSSAFVEAYRGLRTVIALTAESSSNGHSKHGTVLVVASPGAGEGKTTTVAHLAAMLAEVGRSVLVVSADLRRPSVHTFFDVEREPGLTDLLGADELQHASLQDMVKSTKLSRVRVLPSGAPSANPAPLLRRTGDVISAARAVFDYVIVDTPPVLIANDASELATVADGLLVVARAGRTTIDAAQRTAEHLGRLDTPVMGAIIVGATDTPTAYSYYRAGYYTDETTKKPRRGKGAPAPEPV